ncbi:inorganic diphosphatase [Cryobacterium melibiosiphilum]|uniref:Inorganic pyrophosphatase n=1 Tax=Cryobacterium melibiosiphilum TaxID=995039 RepID=A0A3A5MER0_9MICO|nr:inorganic diphosphatase [Cryobacterium melibiosiphilum]RJT85322.1 inorganic diphosphatase [Cryobacterium melibiosiphilum]
MTILDVTVEIPRGSRNKYSVDQLTGRIRLESTLLTEMVYPADSGFIENTLGLDGEPLNALVLLEGPTYPGVGISVRPVGVFRMQNEHGPEVKLVCVPVADPRWEHVLEISDVAEYTRDGIQHFFEHYKDLEPGRLVIVEGFGERLEAERLVTTAMHAYRSHDSYEN